jgi:hypothetical protein
MIPRQFAMTEASFQQHLRRRSWLTQIYFRNIFNQDSCLMKKKPRRKFRDTIPLKGLLYIS